MQVDQLGMQSVFLVSCVGKKREGEMAASDLYCSPWFLKAKKYVERRVPLWFVLSAKYGLVRSDENTSSYDLTLMEMGVRERRAWAQHVLSKLEPCVNNGTKVTFLAGKLYREHLIPTLERKGAEVAVPMRGLGIGEQLSWLNANY